MTPQLPFVSTQSTSHPSVRRAALSALALMAVTGCGSADAGPGEEAMTLPRTIGAWVRQDEPVRYDRETIFDYINGAGEVYRSYAFSHVDVERYQGPEGEGVTVEIFDMGSPADAFGVFSYAREDEQEGIGAGFERKGSILCFWQDRYYVCVAMEREQVDPGPVLEEVARGVSEALPPGGDRPPLVGALPPEGLIPFSDRYFHLHQTLNYNYYLMRENILNLSPRTDAVLARYTPGSTYLVLVEYQDETAAEVALSSFRAAVTPGIGGPAATESDEGGFVSSAQEGPFLVLVLDGSTREATDALRMEAMARLTARRNESGVP